MDAGRPASGSSWSLCFLKPKLSMLSLCQKRRGTTKARSSPEVKVRVTAKAKAAGSRAVAQTVGVAKRVMAYRAKVTPARVAWCVCVFGGVLLCVCVDCQVVSRSSSSRTCQTQMRRRRRANRPTLMMKRQDPPTARKTMKR